MCTSCGSLHRKGLTERREAEQVLKRSFTLQRYFEQSFNNEDVGELVLQLLLREDLEHGLPVVERSESALVVDAADVPDAVAAIGVAEAILIPAIDFLVLRYAHHPAHPHPLQTVLYFQIVGDMLHSQ